MLCLGLCLPIQSVVLSTGDSARSRVHKRRLPRVATPRILASLDTSRWIQGSKIQVFIVKWFYGTVYE